MSSVTDGFLEQLLEGVAHRVDLVRLLLRNLDVELVQHRVRFLRTAKDVPLTECVLVKAVMFARSRKNNLLVSYQFSYE